MSAFTMNQDITFSCLNVQSPVAFLKRNYVQFIYRNRMIIFYFTMSNLLK